MPTDHLLPAFEIERPTDRHRQPVLRAEPVRVGRRPYTGQAWLILAVVLAAIAVDVVLRKSGLLLL